MMSALNLQVNALARDLVNIRLRNNKAFAPHHMNMVPASSTWKLWWPVT